MLHTPYQDSPVCRVLRGPTAKPLWAALLISFAVFTLTNVADAVEPQVTDDASSARGNRSAPWLRRWAREHQRSNPEVLAAFNTVVAQAGQSTLLVYSDGHQVAYGTIVDATGFVVTKASEISGRPTCQLPDGQRLSAQVVGIHSEFDLAMLKVGATELTPARWQTETPIRSGNWLATAGTDATPLAIGIVSVTSRRIPRARAILGIQLDESAPSAQITHVYSGSGAEAAGLKQGDLVIALNKQPIHSARELINQLRDFRPGDRVVLVIQRDDKEHQAVATLQDSSSTPAEQRENNTKSLGRKLSKRHSGFPEAFQHDSTLRPSECGSPVVDLTGLVIGINIAVADRVSTLALPAAAILPVLEDLKSGKYAPTDVGTAVAIIRQREAISRWSRRLDAFEAKHRNRLNALNSAKQLATRQPTDTAAQEALRELEKQAHRAEQAVEETRRRISQLQQLLDMGLSATP